MESEGSAHDVSVKFLLTFDDGPDVTHIPNTTAAVLELLSKNSVQSDIKAIFFVQTRHPYAGGSVRGQSLLLREHAEGHVLGLHSGTVRGHVSHARMAVDELEQSLEDGMNDLCKVTGVPPLFVRPPYWWFNAATVSSYEHRGLNMLLSDVKAYDGVNWGMHIFRRPNIRAELRKVVARYGRRTLPHVQGDAPVVVTFHDTNAYTASHLTEYLCILMEEAQKLELPVSRKPFYDHASDITTAALRRAFHKAPAEHAVVCRDKTAMTAVEGARVI
jgi:peptidoglycan/xylan/chitin deacetylase (PgdA/CDA1 family)